MRHRIKSNGAIVWEGRSLIDDAPIVIIITGIKIPSANQKTGTMIQSYILHQDLNPIAAVVGEEDHSICGNCPLRRGICYVDLRPIQTVWQHYKAGKYPQINERILNQIYRRREMLRFGAYGDPAAAPFEAWKQLIAAVEGWTGYTHLWKSCDLQWQDYLMASTETSLGATQAQKLGWRTFRITLPGEELLPNERMCANALDKDITCYECGLCNGNTLKKAASIADPIHGWQSKINNYKQMRSERLEPLDKLSLA